MAAESAAVPTGLGNEILAMLSPEGEQVTFGRLLKVRYPSLPSVLFKSFARLSSLVNNPFPLHVCAASSGHSSPAAMEEM